VAQKRHFVILRIEVTRASRGLSTIAQLLVTIGINSKSFSWPLHSVQEPTRTFSKTSDAGWRNGMTHNADITQSQAASDDRLLSHVTLGRVECKK